MTKKTRPLLLICSVLTWLMCVLNPAPLQNASGGNNQDRQSVQSGFEPVSDTDPDISIVSDVISAQLSTDLVFEEFDTSKMPEIRADAFLLVESKTGIVICSENANQRIYPASTTKIMTGILAIELGDLDQVMTASANAIKDIGPDGGNIGIIAGENMRLDNLLDALMVRSANEVANIIAENLFDTRQEFIDLMNQRAVELGAVSTWFTNTNGYHDESHYSTTADLARITRYAMKNTKFREYVAKRSIILNPTNKHSSWDRMSNTNALLRSESLSLMSITGVKTGFTTPAGYCIVASAIDDQTGMELISVVMGVRGENASDRRFTMALDLLKYGFNNFRTNTFVSEGEKIETVSVKNAQSKDTVDAVADGSIKLFLPMDSSLWNISRVEYVRSDVTAPVAKGEVLGYIEYRHNGKLASKVDIIAAEEIPDRKGARATPSPTPSSRLEGGNILNILSGGALSSNAGEGPADTDQQSQPAEFPASLFNNQIFRIFLLSILSAAVIISVIRTIGGLTRSRAENRGGGINYGRSRSKALKNYRKRSKWY